MTTMNIRPLCERTVVKRTEESDITRNGLVIPDAARECRFHRLVGAT